MFLVRVEKTGEKKKNVKLKQNTTQKGMGEEMLGDEMGENRELGKEARTRISRTPICTKTVMRVDQQNDNGDFS